MRTWIVVVVVTLAVCAASHSIVHPGPASAHPDPDSAAIHFARALSRFTVPKLEERERHLRSLQQHGYARILLEVVRKDGVMALAAYLKTRLHIEHSISQEPVYVDIAARPDPTQDSLFAQRKPSMLRFVSKPMAPYTIGLTIDWRFPEDPWCRK